VVYVIIGLLMSLLMVHETKGHVDHEVRLRIDVKIKYPFVSKNLAISACTGRFMAQIL
jgi:hypothetical protein